MADLFYDAARRFMLGKICLPSIFFHKDTVLWRIGEMSAEFGAGVMGIAAAAKGAVSNDCERVWLVGGLCDQVVNRR